MSSELDMTRASDTVSAESGYLRNRQRLVNGLGVMAVSMGVYYALRVVQNRPDDIDAAVLFYGTSDGDYEETSMAVLGHFAEDDRLKASAMSRRSGTVQAGDGSVTFYTYPDTEHWFFESDRLEYDEDAAELAWSRTERSSGLSCELLLNMRVICTTGASTYSIMSELRVEFSC